MNYYRITAYSGENNFSFILDSNGMFEKLWEFSAFLISKGFTIVEVGRLENMLDVNIEKVNEDSEHIFLRATCEGKPEYIQQVINGIAYKSIKIADKIYIPNK